MTRPRRRKESFSTRTANYCRLVRSKNGHCNSVKPGNALQRLSHAPRRMQPAELGMGHRGTLVLTNSYKIGSGKLRLRGGLRSSPHECRCFRTGSFGRMQIFLSTDSDRKFHNYFFIAWLVGVHDEPGHAILLGCH